MPTPSSHTSRPLPLLLRNRKMGDGIAITGGPVLNFEKPPSARAAGGRKPRRSCPCRVCPHRPGHRHGRANAVHTPRRVVSRPARLPAMAVARGQPCRDSAAARPTRLLPSVAPRADSCRSPADKQPRRWHRPRRSVDHPARGHSGGWPAPLSIICDGRLNHRRRRAGFRRHAMPPKPHGASNGASTSVAPLNVSRSQAGSQRQGMGRLLPVRFGRGKFEKLTFSGATRRSIHTELPISNRFCQSPF